MIETNAERHDQGYGRSERIAWCEPEKLTSDSSLESSASTFIPVNPNNLADILRRPFPDPLPRHRGPLFESRQGSPAVRNNAPDIESWKEMGVHNGRVSMITPHTAQLVREYEARHGWESHNSDQWP